MQRFIHTTTKRNSSIANSTLKDTLKELIPKRRSELLQLRKDLANNHLPENDITVGSILGGMRGLQLMYWQSSTVDPNLGIKFHGYAIQECQKLLPGPKNPNIFYPEAMFWLLLTGEIPNNKQVTGLTKQLNKIVTSMSTSKTSFLPKEVNKLMETLPSTMHPMTQFSIGVGSLSHFSKFRDNYSRGTINKLTMWEDTFDDVMMLLAFIPSLAGKVYSRIKGKGINNDMLGEFDPKADWAKNLTSMLGLLNKGSSENDEDITDLMRLYTGIHADHEGGNVSAHTTHLVGSALSDPMLSYSAGLLGLAGPLHGLAAQDVVKFLLETQNQIEDSTNEKQLEDYLWTILNNHRVIPGYGHAVLRCEDPRFTALVQFTKERQNQFKDDPNVNLMLLLSKVAHRVLTKYGKCKNPFPNVDNASGILFHHYGLTQLDFVTVLLGCSRAMGPLSQLVWDRIYGLPIERPKSVDFNYLKKFSTLS